MAEEKPGDIGERIGQIREDLQQIREQFATRIVGNDQTLLFILRALLCGGHILLEGVPGIGKTLMVKTIAAILDLKYRRIQFTPDLMPADIVGTNILLEDDRGNRHFRFEEGPIFTNILLADEINRASPKTQSALLQAMEESEVTVFGKTHKLNEIFYTLATQNPIEMAGTYPLPEAQLDRFFYKLKLPFPDEHSLEGIARINLEPDSRGADPKKILSKQRVIEMRKLLGEIPVTDRIYRFASRLVAMTHPDNKGTTEEVKRFIRYGASPRGLNSLIASAKASAVMDGRVNLSIEDIKENLLPSLRHRLVRRFEGDIEGVTSDSILNNLFEFTKKKF